MNVEKRLLITKYKNIHTVQVIKIPHRIRATLLQLCLRDTGFGNICYSGSLISLYTPENTSQNFVD